MDITITWYRVGERSTKLDWCNVLYAYLHPNTDRILYLGKAGRLSVRQRLSGRHKDDVWEYLQASGVGGINLIVGEIHCPTIGRFTQEMLTDIESLLIFRLKPRANIQNTRSRETWRPGMRVRCNGDWPSERTVFIDR